MEVLLMNRPTDHVCKTTLFALILCMWVSMQVMAGTENATHLSARPSSLNIGALFTFNSVIGRAAKPAILAAIDDVNSDQSILRGTKLNIILHDTNCSEFLGTVEAMELINNDVVAAVGPQSSGIAHVISHVVNELHV